MIEKMKKSLFEKAQKRAKERGIPLSFCGNKTNWKDCYTIENYGDAFYIMFWANIGKNTIMEQCICKRGKDAKQQLSKLDCVNR